MPGDGFPIEGQAAAAKAKWEADGFSVKVAVCSPYDNDEVESAAAQLTDPDLEVVILDADRDGIEQISNLLGERSDLSYRIAGVVYLRGAARRKLPYETSGRMRLLPDQPN